jgi:sarcosine oxidase, subunit gamma
VHNGAQPSLVLGSLAAALPSFRVGSGLALELREIAHQRMVELARPRVGMALDAVLGAFRSKGLPYIGETRSGDGSFLLGIGPERWLLIISDEDGRNALAQLGESFEIAIEAGDAWMQLAISGSAAVDLLAKGCALDLHPNVFPEGACATTRFAQLRCVLLHAADGYRLFIGRSYAVSLAEWLIEAAQEFRLEMGDKAPTEAPFE